MIPRHRVKPNGKVDLWDLGPQVAPKAPKAPEEPDKAKLKGAELAAAEIEHEDQLESYKNELRAWNVVRREHREWAQVKGGPIKVEFWGVDARHAIEKEPDRYKLDLPKGMKPGRAQIEAEEVAKAEQEEIERARSQDPLHAGGVPQ